MNTRQYPECAQEDRKAEFLQEKYVLSRIALHSEPLPGP